MCRYKQMDFDLAIFLMVNSLKSPAKLYQHTKRLKQVRNQWHRDDPCLVTAISVLLFIIGIIYGIVLKQEFLTGYVYLGVKFVFMHFVGSGIIMASLCKWIAEKYMMKSEKKAVHSVVNSIETMYAFDIHCNSFFPLFVFSYTIQVIYLLF